MLLLIEIDSEDTKAIIPGKLFEYMASETPVLAIGPANSDIQQILEKTNSGCYTLYSEKDKLKYQILEYFKLYQNKSLKSTPIGLQKYSREDLTKELSQLIKEF